MSRLIAVLLAGIFLTGFYGGIALAEDNAQLQQLLKRTETLEKENDALRERIDTLEEAQQQAPTASTAATLPPAPPDVDGTGFFASTDYNYRKLNNGRAATGWVSGFRSLIGYRIPEDGLDVLVKYNYYRSSADDVQTGYIVTPTSTSITAASINYSIDAAVIEVGERFKLTNALDLRLHLGAQYALIKKSTTSYRITPPVAMASGPEYRLEFDGYGLRLGVDCNYKLGKGLSLTAGISGGFLAGTSKWNQNLILGTYYIQRQESEDVVPDCAADIGLGYDIDMSSSVILNISLGYEFNEYFDVFKGGDFILHGPYFKARLDF